ncbi:MAG: CHAT domain-containing protein [Elainellaceae cyanobacterium]
MLPDEADAARCARASASESASLNGSPARELVESANRHLAAGRLDQARRGFKAAIDRDGALAEAHFGLGLTLTQLVNREQIRTQAPQDQLAQRAAAAYERAIALSPSARAYLNLGQILAYLGQDQNARRAYTCANALHPLIRRVAQEPDAVGTRDLIDAGRWLRRQGLREEALELYSLAIESPRDDQEVNLAAAYNGRGVVLSELDRVDAAIADYERAIALSPAPTPYVNLVNLLQYANRRDQLTQVYADLKAFLLEQLNTVEQPPQREYGADGVVDFFLNRATFLSENQPYYALYIDLLMNWHNDEPEAGFDQIALQVSERARARSLLEVLTKSSYQQSQNDAAVAPELIRRERSLQAEISRSEARFQRSTRALEGLLVGAAADLERQRQQLLDEASAAESEYFDLTQQRSAVLADIRKVDPDYANILQPKALSVEAIQQLLPEDDETLVLQYWLGENRSYLWAISRDSFSSYELPDRQAIESLAQQVHSYLQVPNQTRRALNPADQLSRWLIGPIANQLDDQRLVIVADGALHYLPFGALPNEPVPEDERDDWPDPLLANHEVVNLPSMSALSALLGRQPQQGADLKLAAIADPVFARGDRRLSRQASGAEGPARSRDTVSRLLGARQEAEEIIAEAKEAELDTLAWIDFDASRENVLSGALQNYDIIHFATHGVLNDQDPTQSGLELSRFNPNQEPQTGLLSFSDIFGMNLAADLVVLSACDTGRGPVLQGEGIVGLTQAFMYAGADSVIVSLWPVEDQATRDLMVRFYDELLDDGHAPAEALRAAQMAMFKRQDNGNPYFWAAFTLQGRWDQVFEVD